MPALALPPPALDRHTFEEVLTAIYAQRYCGTLLISFQHGAPTVIEVPVRDVQRLELQVPLRTRA